MADQNIKDIDILEKVSELPDDLRKALFARSTTDTIQSIGKNAGLPIDKIGELADETGKVMLGLTSPSDYVKNLTARLGVPQEKAKMIAEEINQKVFQPVRESLKRVHGLATPPPAPPLSRGGEKEKVEISPPLQGGAGKVKKPLPTIADLGIDRLPKKEEIASYIEETKAKIASEKTPGKETIPPIFVKNVPLPSEASAKEGQPQQIFPEKSLAAKGELEKALGQPIPPTPLPPEQKYQKDPYREQIE